MIAVNLLPWRQARLRRQRRVSLSIGAAALLLLALLAAWQLWRLDCASQRLRAAQREARAALAESGDRLAQRRALQQQLAAQQAQWRRVRRHADQLLRWHQFWQALPALLPDPLWLDRVEKQPERLSIEGRAQSMQAIGELRRRLGGLPLFAAIKQGSVERQPDGLYRFTLRAYPGEVDDE